MKVLGIEFAASYMNYVGVSGSGEDFDVIKHERMELHKTRERESLVAFQDAVVTLFNEFSPKLIAIKDKPEAGRMPAGAAALKMEGIVLANAPCQVAFISGHKINQVSETCDGLYQYSQASFKTALAALRTFGS